ncbi:hypothetical protein [Amycolatopsis sp. 3B14]|uniref:hypothetical protein n=1 Tax=Amycolatopsis sp. 3B14 TaxID=3243600 RepID=UPI003D977E1C
MNTAPDPTQRTRRRQPGEAVEVVCGIDLVDGSEAERLGLQQAAVIRDVLLWCRQQRVTGRECHLTAARGNWPARPSIRSEIAGQAGSHPLALLPGALLLVGVHVRITADALRNRRPYGAPPSVAITSRR